MILHGRLCCVFCRREFRSVHEAGSSRHHAECGLWHRPTPDGHRYTIARELVSYPGIGIVMEQIATYDTRAEAEARLERLKGAT